MWGRYYLPRKLSDKLGKVVEGCIVQQGAVEMVVLEVLTKGHPHVEDILRVPVMPILRIENEFVILLLVICLVDIVAVKESVVTVLVVETHFYLFFLRFFSLVRWRRAACCILARTAGGVRSTPD
jgi:hypothetical protein